VGSVRNGKIPVKESLECQREGVAEIKHKPSIEVGGVGGKSLVIKMSAERVKRELSVNWFVGARPKDKKSRPQGSRLLRWQCPPAVKGDGD